MKFLITGGTGTFGKALIKRLIDEHEVIVFSRDEYKQQQLKLEFPQVRTVIGDVRNYVALKLALKGVDVCVHAAALKHIDIAEDNPYEAVRTNVAGTQNLVNAVESNGVPRVIFCSTDKAVLPLNIYGMTKGIAERMLINRNRMQSSTKYISYRWGNILASRGSVVEKMVKDLRTRQCVSLTDPEMTRFWLKIEDAVEFVLSTFQSASGNEVLVPPKMKASTILVLAHAVASALEINKFEILVTGDRNGEKMHEVIKTKGGEASLDSKRAEQFTVPELTALIRTLVLEMQ